MKKLLLRLSLIIIASLWCQSLFSQIRIYSNYRPYFLSEEINPVRLNLSNEDAGDNTFYPSSEVPYGITMTNTNNLVDRSGHWEFVCVGKRKGVAYIQHYPENWSKSVGLDEGYAYVAKAKYDNNSRVAIVYIYCERFLLHAHKDYERGIIGAAIEYYTDWIPEGAVSPEIFEEGFRVNDPMLATLFIDHADTNGDAMISREERYAVTKFFLRFENQLNLRDGNTYLQYFPNLRALYIGPYIKKNNRTGFSSDVYQGHTVCPDVGYGVCGDKLIVENLNVDTINICFRNKIKHVDLSRCPNLKVVTMENVSCTDIVLPTSIEVISTTGNNWESLDLSTYNNLHRIVIGNSQCQRMVLPSSAKTVECKHGQLSSIDLSRCKNLECLYVEENKLTSLDLSQCKNLTDLACWSNPLKSLDISNNERLESLYCSNCDFTELDLTKNKNLKLLQVQEDGFENKLKKIYLPTDHVYMGNYYYYTGNNNYPTDFSGIEVINR